MPIRGRSDRRRIPRLLKVRLGVKETLTRNGQQVEYPKEVDYFVIKEEDGATKEVLDAYSGQPKELLCMLLMEVEAAAPDTGANMQLLQLNRAYSAGHGLRCAGDGGDRDNPGWASTDDEAWAKRIVEVVGGAVEPKGRFFQVPCLGRDCPKYLLLDRVDGTVVPAAGHDGKSAPAGAAACTGATVLRCMLLHPEATVEGSEHFGEVLTLMEVATGSYNAMVDLNSSFDLLRGMAGRTGAIPFWLLRRPITTYGGGTRSKHWTLVLRPTPRIWQIFGQIQPRKVLMGRQLQQEYALLRQADVDFDSVKDLLPESWWPKALPPAPDLPETADDATAAEMHPGAGQAPVDATEATAEAMDTAEQTRILTEAERTTLKRLFGNPVDPANTRGAWSEGTADKLRAAVAEADAALGTTTTKLVELQARHYAWMVAKYGQAQQDQFFEEAQT